ncbi:MAG: aminomethyltransferase family protein, partial [Geminicoccaceae bacterium]
YCLRHEIPFPHFNRLAGRPIKPSPFYDRLKAKGAVFEEVFGHERPRWVASRDVPNVDHYSFRRNVVHDIVGEEVRAVRERVGIMDISAFSKVEVQGADASVFLDKLIANRLPRTPGGVVLTHLLNERGRIEIELTVARLDEDSYYLTCAAFFEQRLLDHLDRYRSDENIEIVNLSDNWAALALQGPKSRDVLAACADAALDNASFPWLRAQKIRLGDHRPWALRMSYAGELGWEFHGPRENMLQVYDALWTAGEPYGIVDYGSFAMNVMRLEKGFKGAGELTNEVTLPEADVMRFVKLEKPGFIGKMATELSLRGPRPWACVYLGVESDGDADGHGGEAVLMKGEVVGTTSSIAYGHSVGKILAFAYVKPEAATPGTALEVVIMGKPRTAEVLAEPAYDPENLRPRMDPSCLTSPMS